MIIKINFKILIKMEKIWPRIPYIVFGILKFWSVRRCFSLNAHEVQKLFISNLCYWIVALIIGCIINIVARFYRWTKYFHQGSVSPEYLLLMEC